MIAERLRKAVLQAAMEGKLTEQFDSDGSALSLVINPKLTENGLSDKLLPKNWVISPISNIGYVIGGGTPKTSMKEYWSGDIPWVTPADMWNKQGNYISHGIRSITKEGLDKSSARLLPKGSILLSSRAPIGYIAIASNPIATNQGFKSIVPNNLEMNKYIYYFLMSIVNELQELGTGTTFKEISGATLKKVLIPIPPLAEQKRIVEKLEVLLAEIDKLEQDEKALKELEDNFPEKLKNAILQAAIQGRISNQSIDKDNSYNHSGINENKQITYEEIDKTGLVVPTTWRFYKLVDVSDVIGGYAFKSSKYLKSNIENGVRVIRISDFNNDGLIDNSPVYYDEDNKLSRYEIRENDILLCMTGGTVGKNTLVNIIDKKLYLNQRVAAIRNNSPSLLNTEYLHIVLNTPYIQKIINDSKNSTNDNISMRQINNFIIPIPPLKEQMEIINKIKKLSNSIETM